ncbi:MAG: cyclodeaminase/cyclohydrolase family protein [Eubacteriales bacterium]|nr:cyclodeaminase/cyclohydrolase family protein [Eubacteriales bacterium]
MTENQRIIDFLNELKSEAPTPGGGAVAALTGAQGAALIMMVANLTIGKKKYAEYEELNVRVRDAAQEVLDKLIQGIDEDKEAFGGVSQAYGMPKSTDEEKEARKKAISEASVAAGLAPLNACRAALRGLQLTQELIGKSNRQLVSDLYVATLNLNACIQAAKMNVVANTPALSDRKMAEAWDQEVAEIVAEAAKISSEILAEA